MRHIGNNPTESDVQSVGSPRGAFRLRAAVLGLGLAGAATLGVAAHEGHGVAQVKPVYQTVKAGDAHYRVGFAMQPPDAMVGEEVRLELQLLRFSDATAKIAGGVPVSSKSVQVQIISVASPPYSVPEVGTGDRLGTYVARHRFVDGGPYEISARLDADGHTIAAEFPIVVSTGPIPRTVIIGDAIVVLVLGALASSLWRRRQIAASARSLGAAEASAAAAGLVVLVAGHLWISPAIGHLLLPERHPGMVPWGVDPAAARAGAAPLDQLAGPPRRADGAAAPLDNGGRSAASGAEAVRSAASVGTHEIVSTVVPIPGRMVEVVIPMSARLLFDAFTPRVGRTVKAGQTLANMEQHYILHDAVHLINQRWLYVLPMLATKRQRLEAELNLLRQRHLLETGDAAVKQMMTVTQAVQAAELALATAALEEERAAKLLEMHDAQITEEELVVRPLTAPIAGTIESVSFTQGQLKYENDRLLTILDLSRLWVEARFPGDAIGQPPRRLTFLSSAFPTIQFEGELARVADALDPASGTLSAFYEVQNRDRLLRVGMPLIATSANGGAMAAIGPVADVVERAEANGGDSTVLTGLITADPERTAEVTAPLWGRIEFAGRHLAVGDRVRKGDTLLNVVLELSVDERYPMNARGVEIASALEMAKTRRVQAEEQRTNAIAQLKANPKDRFVQIEAEIIDRIFRGAQEEEEFFTRQADAYQGTIKRRDPKTTPIVAPISGVITEIGFRPGELNRTDEFRKLLTIVDTSRVWLEAPVYESQSATVLRDFGSASFTSPSVPAARALDRPLAVSGMVNPVTGALTAIFAVPNPGGALKIGASARIVVTRE